MEVAVPVQLGQLSISQIVRYTQLLIFYCIWLAFERVFFATWFQFSTMAGANLREENQSLQQKVHWILEV